MCSYGLHKFMSRLTHNILKEFHNKSILVKYPWDILIKSSEQLKRTTNEVDDTIGFSHWSAVRSLTIALRSQGIIVPLTLSSLKHFSLPWTLFEVGGAEFIMNSKIHLRKISLKAYFKTILHYFGLNSLSGSTADVCTELKPVLDLINQSHRSAGKEPIHCWFGSM